MKFLEQFLAKCFHLCKHLHCFAIFFSLKLTEIASCLKTKTWFGVNLMLSSQFSIVQKDHELATGQFLFLHTWVTSNFSTNVVGIIVFNYINVNMSRINSYQCVSKLQDIHVSTDCSPKRWQFLLVTCRCFCRQLFCLSRCPQSKSEILAPRRQRRKDQMFKTRQDCIKPRLESKPFN